MRCSRARVRIKMRFVPCSVKMPLLTMMTVLSRLTSERLSVLFRCP
uniref:Uncharacterized protein n=1 Tax=Arundo donax TaxID=35708 RepID=A0A0A8Z6L2_ARUDO